MAMTEDESNYLFQKTRVGKKGMLRKQADNHSANEGKKNATRRGGSNLELT